jgi:hypothetical protein
MRTCNTGRVRSIELSASPNSLESMDFSSAPWFVAPGREVRTNGPRASVTRRAGERRSRRRGDWHGSVPARSLSLVPAWADDGARVGLDRLDREELDED